MDVREAIRHAIDGRAILFTGAGFSYGAKNIHEKPFPSGADLSSELLGQIGYPGKVMNLDKASSAYLRQKNSNDLINLLIERFSLGKVTPSHRKIALLPWKRVYTTNYDLVLEEAARLESIVCNSIDAADDPRDHLFKRNLVVHLNGAINRISEERLHSTFKLINESYAADSFENSGWAFHFRNDVRTAAAIIFIGYSMYDLDIRRVLFNEDIAEKCLFVVGPIKPEDELELDDLRSMGHVAPIGIDNFAREVAEELQTYRPVEPSLMLESWKEIPALEEVGSKPSDREVLDFLTEGRLCNPLLVEAIGPNKKDFLIDHIADEKLKDHIVNQDGPAVVIGELGTGKTFTLDVIARYFAVNGWRVFGLNTADSAEISEVENICQESGRKILIVENYHRHMDLLRWLSEAKPSNTKILLSARSSVHELYADDLIEIFQERVIEFDLSILRSNEVQSAVNLFDRYGFWGNRIGSGVERKRAFIRNDCGASLPSLLVHILQARHITDRYKTLLSDASNRADVEAILICAFTLEVIDCAPKVAHVQELLGNKVNWPKVRSQQELKTIIDIKSHAIYAKSSVLALHLLHSVFSAKRIVETLTTMAIAAEERREKKEFADILNLLMRYSSIASILPNENKLQSTVSFYEGIKNLRSTSRNPQFWLQYAIACLTLGQLDRAERYFADAYDLVYAGYNTFMLDNAYSRLLLEKCMHLSNVGDIILIVDKAREIILRQMSVEKRFYPYRVALGFFKVFDRFAGSWTPKQNEYFRFIFSEIKRNAEMADGKLKDQKYVRECSELAAQKLG